MVVKGGKPRHKVLRNNIQRITKPAIQRLAQRAGVKSLSGLVYDETRRILKTHMESTLRNCITSCEHARRKRVMLKDLNVSLTMNNQFLGSAVNPNSQKATFGGCKPRPVKKGTVDNPKRKAKPGTGSLRDIRFQQKNSDCLIFPRAAFGTLTREIGQDFKENLTFAAEFLEMFQLVCENYLTELFNHANLCTIHAGRSTLHQKDLLLVQRVHGDTLF